MIEPAQVLLIIVVSALTILLMVIGVQVFFILTEVRRSVEKINKILDDTGQISDSIARPLSSLSNSLTNFSGVTALLSWLVAHKKKVEKKAAETNE